MGGLGIWRAVYRMPFAAPLPQIAGGVFVIIILTGIVGLWRETWRPVGLALPISLGLLIWWDTIQPSHDRDWIPELARLPRVEMAARS